MSGTEPGQSINPFENFRSIAAAPPSGTASGIQWGASSGGQSQGAWGAPRAEAYDVETTYVPPSTSDVVPPAWGSQVQGGAWHNARAAAAPADGNTSASTFLLPASAIPSDATVPAVPSTTAQLAFTESTAAPVAKGNMGSGGAWAKGNGNSGFQPSSSTDPRPLLSPPTPSSSSPVGDDPTKYAFYNIRKYRPYFNVDTAEVLWRVLSSFIGAFKPDFMQVTSAHPDLYGPFWIATTLIFVTAAAGNFSSYIAWRQHQGQGADAGTLPPAASSGVNARWYSDPTKLGTSAAMFYGYAFIVSLGLWFWVRMLKGDVKLVNMLCIYGYALTIFIPISVLCVVPVEAVRWVFVVLATLMSGGFLLMNMRDTVSEVELGRSVWLLGAVVVLHLGLGVALKLYFFSY